MRSAPLAFAPPTPELVEKIRLIGRNFVCSELPAGTPMLGAESTGAMMEVSAGHTDHPTTTFAARDELFAFLDLSLLRAKEAA